jgi:hypothetical protein
LQWHSYEDKQTRDLKVITRGLPPNSKLSENYRRIATTKNCSARMQLTLSKK